MSDEHVPGLMCITNSMTDARSCTVRGEHQIICDGRQYRYNPDHARDEWTGRDCHGCLPREAQVGLLCYSCYDRVLHAWNQWTPERRTILTSIDRAVQRDNGGIRSGHEGYVPIPGTMLAVEEIDSYTKSLGRKTLVEWLSDTAGAADAIRFARAVPAALRTHELEEKAHRVQRVRCPKCNRINLVWNPTEHTGDHVKITCQNPECDAILSQSRLEFEELIQARRPRRNVG